MELMRNSPNVSSGDGKDVAKKIKKTSASTARLAYHSFSDEGHPAGLSSGREPPSFQSTIKRRKFSKEEKNSTQWGKSYIF